MPIEDWSPVISELMNLRDQMAELISISYFGATKKPYGRIRPARRPQTAYTRLKSKARMEQHFELVAEVEEAQERYRKT